MRSQIKRLLRQTYNTLFQTAHEKIVEKWYADDGENALRLEYPLNKSSLVFDLGGFEGQWASNIYSRFCCKVHIFEPLPHYAARIRHRFSANSSIIVHEFGIGSRDEEIEIALAGDRSSSFHPSVHSQTIKGLIVSVEKFLNEYNIAQVDLLKINIEGAEYDLLEFLIKTRLIQQFGNVQVQFHAFVPHAVGRRLMIQKQLKETHELTYNYPFVWESWRRRL